MADKDENALIKERKKKLDELRSRGIEPYPYSYDTKHKTAEIAEKYKKLGKEQKTKDIVNIAGRLLSLRKMGKVIFAHLQDSTGKIQLYFRQDDLGREKFKLLKFIDIGDIIGAKGTVFRTKMGEITVNVSKFPLLTKTLRPLPEKYHGLKDTELRYRKRYLDILINPKVKKIF